MTLPPAVNAGVRYFAVIFALGFVLGTLRVLWLAPWIGESAAVLCELPLMLAASWFVARGLVRRHAIDRPPRALAMGAIALVLLLAFELLLALATGSDADAWLASLGRVPGLIGLAGQVAFGVMPWAVQAESRPA